ncbi:MAG TPA: V-type ATPase subunit [Dissulfurispiraceae bacterium]|nr:V-type ATPase subunit [Dissulfurispiraceae bacterium]
MGKSRNVEFLRKTDDRGYPTEYLLSRIRGRRAHLIADWRSLVLSDSPVESLALTRYGSIMTDNYPEAIRQYLLKDFGWVYSQMNRTLREIFRPFFLYTELGTIFICLRNAMGKETGKIESVLSLSLLSDKIKRILRGGEHLLSAVGGLEDCFTALSTGFSGLRNTLENSGLQAVELTLSTGYLEYIVQSKLHPVIKDFFVYIIDSRNILSLYKYIWLNGKNTPPFITGGRISETMFMKTADKKDILEIGSLVRKLTKIESGTANIETSLYRMVTRLLKKAGGEPLGVGLILNYLWRSSLEATNLSILLYGSEIDRESITAEIVQ